MKRWNLLEESDEAIFVVNENGKILFTNKAFDDLFGYEDNDLIGRQLTELIPSYTHQETIWTNGLAKSGNQFKVKLEFSKLKLKRREVYFGVASKDFDPEDQLAEMTRELEKLNMNIDRVSSLMSLPIKNKRR